MFHDLYLGSYSISTTRHQFYLPVLIFTGVYDCLKMPSYSNGRFRRSDVHIQADHLSPYLPHPLSDGPFSISERRQSSLDNWTQHTPSVARRLSDMSTDFTATDTFSQAQASEQVTVTSARTRERSNEDSGLTEEERRRRFRLLDRADVRYLGFVPSRNDKRPYLNAVPLVGKIPDGQATLFSFPVSSTQVWTYIIFILFIAIAGAASFFYIRNILSSGNQDKSNQ